MNVMMDVVWRKIVLFDIYVLCSTLEILHFIFCFGARVDSLAIGWDT